jgi:sigma-B regulation protein RsbU (phosphoserine phosphatase)
MSSDDPTTGEKTLHCTEVWGGNRRVERTVVLPGLDAWVYSQPCDHAAAGGDVHYVSACAGGQVVRILVADVSGHGPAVADTADALRRLMRRLVNDHDQRRLVRDLNTQFATAAAAAKTVDGQPAEFRFATAVALTYDSYTGHLLACNAGHPPPLWYRSTERRWTTLEPAEVESGRNVPVGVLDGIDFEQFGLDVAVGDLVLCHTDSLVEARYADGRQLGTEGLLDLVRSVDTDDAAALVPAVVSALGRLDAGNLTRDDLTCLLLRVNGSRPAVPLVDRLLSPARAAAGLAGVHLPSIRRRKSSIGPPSPARVDAPK